MNITSLLEFRRLVRIFYIRYEQYVKYAVRFLMALILIGLINSRMGYWGALSGFGVTLLASLLCAVLPMGFTAFICAALIIAHLYRYSIESCGVAMILFLCVYLMYYRFSPHDAFVILLTPILFAMHIPSIMPFVVGLAFTPVSAMSMSFGVVIWFFLHNIVRGSAEADAAGAEERLERVQGIVGGMVDNKTMAVYVIAFAVAALLIYGIRRLSINRSWMIAIAAGAFSNLLILLIGDVALDANVGIAGAFIGTILGIVIAFVILFFKFNLDYSRVEQVQFEDEEYYYYVKAIPKFVLQERQPRSKSINRSLDVDSSSQGATGAHAQGAGNKPHAKQQQHSRAKDRDSGELTKERQRAIRAGVRASK